MTDNQTDVLPNECLKRLDLAQTAWERLGRFL